ncbi:MAG: hypothetical protein LKE40_07665 [Spirochaetia bacterium]|nr:hypothetical protein [Spirochaetia bacterium]
MKILVLVKTYPQPSNSSGETVCTAGMTEDGNWIRIYPIPLRMYKDEKNEFKKWDWIEVEVEKRDPRLDPRKESYHCDYRTIKVVGSIGTENATWKTRKTLCLQHGYYTSIDKLILDSKTKTPGFISLAVFKPKKITRLVVTPVAIEERQQKRDEIEKKFKQQRELFPEFQVNDMWQMSEELPYCFRYEFLDSNDKSHTIQIEDWEMGALFRKYKGNDELALQKVREKYEKSFIEKKDIYFFMGTVFKNHMKNTRNPWAIIGVFYPPKSKSQKEIQLELF